MLPWTVQSQIIDDSTKQVYGAYTTLYTTYDQFLNELNEYHEIDTFIHKIHRYNYVERSNHHYQDLGNIGTAMHPVFYSPPTAIGARSGFDAFTPYYQDASNIHFYDTKSPYTLLNINFGGGQRTVTDIIHARNITPYWNAGFQFTSITSQKQIKSVGRNDFQVRSIGYHFHTHYLSPNGKYTGLGYVSRLNHRVREQGGIISDETTPFVDFFDDAADIYLRNAESRDFRLNIFTYNEYNLIKAFQLYHNFEYIGNTNRFTNKPLAGNFPDINYYDRVLISSDSTTDQARISQVINEAGIKGAVGKAFYRFYLKFRNYNFRYNYIPDKFSVFEGYAGYHARFKFDSLHYLRSDGEYLIGGNYKINAVYRNKFFDATFNRTQYDPAVIEQRWFGNHGEWSNNFRATTSDHLSGRINVWFKDRFRISPKLSLTNISRQVYFDEDKTPQQASGAVQLLQPGVEMRLRLTKSIFFEADATYTLKTGTTSEAQNAIRIPDIFVNSSLFYSSELFERRLNLKAGLDLHYKSAWMGYGYDPTLQQFHIQNRFTIPEYPLVDFFINTRVSWATIFLKMENLAQPENSGYLTFYQYRGMPRTFTLGITWAFFD